MRILGGRNLRRIIPWLLALALLIWSVAHVIDTLYASTLEGGLARFKAHVEEGEPLDGVWHEDVAKFYISAPGLYYMAICKPKSPGATPQASGAFPRPTRGGVVVDYRLLEGDYWWVKLKW